MHIIDTHAHLDHVENLPEVLAEASRAGISSIITMGEDLASNQKNFQISRDFSAPRIYPGFGMHPGSVHREEWKPCRDFILEHIADAVAIGEIGLDFWYQWVRKDPVLQEKQKDIFRCQLQIAQEHHLPAVIHSRGAWKESLEITQDVGHAKALFHWYSGPLDVLSGIIESGYYISCSPSLSYSKPSQEAACQAPLERILIETDTPVYYRTDGRKSGFTATPKDVIRTLEALSHLRQVPVEEAAEILNANACRFFELK